MGCSRQLIPNVAIHRGGDIQLRYAAIPEFGWALGLASTASDVRRTSDRRAVNETRIGAVTRAWTAPNKGEHPPKAYSSGPVGVPV